MIAGTATLTDEGTLDTSFLRRKLHNHDLPCNKEPEKAFFRSPDVHHQFETLGLKVVKCVSGECTPVASLVLRDNCSIVW